MTPTEYEEEFAVRVTHRTDEVYGDHVIELWRSADGRKCRPNDLPAFTIYDGKTGAILRREWYVRDNEMEIPEHGQYPYREGGKPPVISDHPKNPYIEWWEADGYFRCKELPIDREIDPNTGDIVRFIYASDAADITEETTNKSQSFPTYDL